MLPCGLLSSCLLGCRLVRGRLLGRDLPPQRLGAPGLGDPFLRHPHDRLGGRLPGRLLLTVRAGGQRQHDAGGPQRHLRRVHPLGEHLVPGVDGVLDPLLHAAIDAPGVAVIGQHAEVGEQARQIVGAPAGAHRVDVEQAHHLAVLDEHLRLVEVAVHHVVRAHVHALLESRQTVTDRPDQGIESRTELRDGGADDPGIELHRLGPRRAQRERVHRGGQPVQQRHEILGAAGVHALVDHGAGQRAAGQLREDHQAIVVGHDLRHRHPGREQPVMAVHDLAAAMGLHDLEIDRPVTLRGAQHRPAPGTVGDDVDRDRQRRVRTDVHAQVVEGAADDVRVADQRQHRQPRVVGVAPHPHVDVTVGHHQGLLGDVEVLLTLADVGAGPEQLLAGGCLGAIELGPRDHRAVESLRGAPGAVVDVVELPAVQHAAGVADGRAEQPSRTRPGEELGAVLRL